MTVRAIIKQIEDPNTGVVTNFHVLSVYTVNLGGGMSTAAFQSYVSKEKFEAGKRPVTQLSETYAAVPDAGVGVPEWLLEKLTAPRTADSQPVGNYTFAEGTVYTA